MKWLLTRASALTMMSALLLTTQAWSAEPESVPGEYIVRMSDETSLKGVSKQDLSQALGAYVKGTIPSLNIAVVKKPVIETQKSVISSMKQNPLVKYVEPNFIYRANVTPNDPLLEKLWGIHNRGQLDPAGVTGIAGIDVGAQEAWSIQTGSKDVIVAVIDTGVNYDSPDLKENIWVNEAELNGQPGVDDDKNGYVDDIHGYNFVANTGDPKDDQNHGSHCSGTIGAKGNDGKGIVGVAWDVRIMGVKFLGSDGSGSLDGALRAVEYATKMGAKIMSNSWGGGGYSEALKEAIENANKAGALFVAAAGNESTNIDSTASYPAAYEVPNVLAVAAINNRGTVASFSNYGKKHVHVAAPGVNVYSTTSTEAYATYSGTSMATPHVSGVAALIASQFPTMTNLEIKERIVSTAKPLRSLRNKVKSSGVANAYLALTNTTPAPDANDPVNWPTQAVSHATAHPYDSKTQNTFEIRVEGAKQIAVYFEKFETEDRYDNVEFYDANGNKISTLSGVQDESFSDAIAGDYVKIVFTSDDSVQKYGFDITKVAYR